MGLLVVLSRLNVVHLLGCHASLMTPFWSWEMVQGHFPWYGAGCTYHTGWHHTKTDLTVSRLLHNVDIVLGVNWLKSVNPLIDWCSGKVYMPNAIHTALLEGRWLSSKHAIGTVGILSNSKGLKCIQDDKMKNSTSILRTPQFWSDINSRRIFPRRKT